MITVSSVISKENSSINNELYKNSLKYDFPPQVCFRDMAFLLDPATDCRDFLFFDIETTGLDSHNDSIYLIGAMYMRDEELVIDQFFSEFYEDEENIINAFFNLSRTHRTLVNYNGGRFDIPFIEARYANYCDEKPFSLFKSHDLYALMKNYRDILGLSSMRQPVLEKYCGFVRNDCFSGGELIDYYLKYLALSKTEEKIRISESRMENAADIPHYSGIMESGLPELGRLNKNDVFDALMLHNYEDVYGMLECGKALNLIRLMEGNLSLDISYEQDCICLKIKYPENCYRSFLSQKINSDEDGLVIMLPVMELDLKLFFDNYKDYYFIPAQDIAIHKSLSDFYDKSIRQKATKSTCFNKCHGKFVKGPSHDFEGEIKKNNIKTFKEDYYEKSFYLDCSVFNLQNKEQLKLIAKYYLMSMKI